MRNAMQLIMCDQISLLQQFHNSSEYTSLLIDTITYNALLFRLYLLTTQPRQMQNEAGEFVDLYVPRKWLASVFFQNFVGKNFIS